MPLELETFAIPVTQGINVTAPARLLQPAALLEAQNSKFLRGGGAQKRRGHVASKARANKPIPPGLPSPTFDAPDISAPYTNQEFPDGWVFGFGVGNRGAEPDVALPTSDHPTIGLSFGSAQRDNETVMWDGHRLVSRSPGQNPGALLPTFNAVMPAYRSSVIAKSNLAQAESSAADTGRIRVAAWKTGTTLYYTVIDSKSGATIVPATDLEFDNVGPIRVICVGQWVHIVAHDSDDLLHRHSVFAETPRSLTSASLGDCIGHYDLYKNNDNEWMVLRNTDGTELELTWHYASGQQNTQNFSTLNPVVTANPFAVAVCSHPQGDRFAVVWRGDSGGDKAVLGQVYEADGTGLGETVLQIIDVTDLEKPVTVVPKYEYSADTDSELFNAFFDYVGVDTSGGFAIRRFDESSLVFSKTQYHLYLASTAIRIGDRSLVWAGHTSTLQSSWFLLDESLGPVGRAEYITANVNTSDPRSISQINFQDENPTAFHGALDYRIRVASDPGTIGTNPPVVYADPSLKFYEVDVLPPLRAAQAGRSLYFAGAQVWSYDGLELVEAGFHLAPELPSAPTASGSGSGLSAGTYTYRVDLCSRNAFNEEHRSASFYTSPVVTTSGQEVTLTINTCLTRRDNSYFLIYRNQANGTQWYLISSRDPSSADFVENDLTVDSFTYIDDGSITDAELVSQEPHPANGGFGYIDTFTAPPCEIIASGHDRLWVAGGELAPGQVLPSRLFIPTETPGFHLGLVVQVDRYAEPITAIGFVGETRAYFRRTQTYVHQGEGPDNSSRGFWEPVRLAYADVGAVGPESLGLITQGLLFQSPAGIRLISAGGGLTPIGTPVDSLAKTLDIRATLVCGDDQEVRFYHDDGTLVFNYQYGVWSTWTCAARGATRHPDTGLALLVSPDAFFWAETEGAWLDNGHPYKHRIRFAWLRKGDLMDFQRIRRIGALGETDMTKEHSIHVDVYYDERDFAEETFDWSYPDPNTQNTDEFGAATFGAGAFGDTGDD